MSTQGKPHPLAVDVRDVFGRRWCRVCGLPENNARAKRLHTIPTQRDRRSDWRDRAYPEREW